jgi:putative methionine-R-sulfoxide reductase with GAF domain
MDNYLKQAGLEEFIGKKDSLPLNDFVEECFSLKKDFFRYQEIEELYKFDVPKLGPNGSCAVNKTKEEKKYNLALTLGLQDRYFKLRNHPQTLRLWRLKQVLKKLMEEVKPDWLGVYRRTKNRNGEWVLLKESYLGAYSRAEFPLAEEFAKGSNNSTVGLTGRAVVFGDLAAYQGPYYECDNQVQSEFCAPIFNNSGEVMGIIDAESFRKNFFTKEKISELSKVCSDLGAINLGVND